MKKAKVIVAGTNHFTDYDYLASALDSVFSFRQFDKKEIVVIPLGEDGFDEKVKQYAEEHHLSVKQAKWKYLRRSEEAVKIADAAVIFGEEHSYLMEHLKVSANAKNIPVWIFPHEKNREQREKDSKRLQLLEFRWQDKCRREDLDDDEEHTEVDVDDITEKYERWCRHDMSPEDWGEFQHRMAEQKWHEWLQFAPWRYVDYDYEEIFPLLQFKLKRMIAYWKQFSHCANGEYICHQMELAVRLLQVIMQHGNESGDCDTFPYQVNMRNVHRFPIYYCSNSFYGSEMQKIRYQKAYCLFFKFLQYNLHRWWD